MGDTLMAQNFEFAHQSLPADSGRRYHKWLHHGHVCSPDRTAIATEHSEALNCSRSMARFLCGLTSPALTRSKLSRNPAFGICQDIPFDQLMRQF